MKKLDKSQKLMLYTLGTIGYLGFIKLNMSKYEVKKIKDIIDGLEQEDGLTGVDEYLKNIHIEDYYCEGKQVIDNSYNTTIEDLENNYITGYLDNKKDICNNSLRNMIRETLEAEIIEEYNLEPEKISNFNIIGKRLYSKDHESYRDKYGVEFYYDNNLYEIYANNKTAHKICFAYRALGYNELNIDEMEEYYELLKEILVSNIEKKDKEGKWSYYNDENIEETIEYNGLFKIKEDKEKEKAVKKYIKKLEQ